MDRSIDLTQNFLFSKNPVSDISNRGFGILSGRGIFSKSFSLVELLHGSNPVDERQRVWSNTTLLIGVNSNKNEDYLKYCEIESGKSCFCCGKKENIFKNIRIGFIGICGDCDRRMEQQESTRKWLQS